MPLKCLVNHGRFLRGSHAQVLESLTVSLLMLVIIAMPLRVRIAFLRLSQAESIIWKIGNAMIGFPLWLRK